MPSEQTFNALALALSHSAIAVLVIAAILAARDARQTLQGKLLFLLSLSVAALAIASGPDALLLPPTTRVVIGIVGAANVALLWLFCLSILRDDFELRRFEWAGAIILLFGTLLVLLRPDNSPPIVSFFSAAAPFVSILHIGWVAFSERSGDLVEARRRARFWIPGALAVAAFVSVLSEEVGDATIASIIRNGLATLPIGIVLLLWLVALDPSRLRFEKAPKTSARSPQIDPRDVALYAALQRLMSEAHAYREPELTIDAMAERLSTPPHRLRSLINGGLGFRNFAAFINGFRLEHAKAALADPQRSRETILSIAFDAGFASLQTFNRVFRDVEGITPTAYRATALADPSQNQKTPPNL